MLAMGGAAGWPLAARAQPRAMPVIGFLRSTAAADADYLVTAFRQGLKQAGFVEGENLAIEFRWGEGRADRLPVLAAELVRRSVAVIVGDGPSVAAAKTATTTVPIVFANGGDPVGEGLVTSLNRPGGNITGVHFFSGVLGAKRLELLRQLVPKGSPIGMLVFPNTPNTEAERKDVVAAAQSLGQPLIVLDVAGDRDIEEAFATLAQRRAGAVQIGSGPFMTAHRQQILALEIRHKLPACYPFREYAVDGGLMSYGASITEGYRQAGVYAGRILKGEKPGDLPVMRSTKFEFVINLKTAKTLGVDIPPTLLALADEVIE